MPEALRAGSFRAPLTLLEAACSPGSADRLGDDRYGFDSNAGAAWVIDGASDATTTRLFPGESDAAWWAATLNEILLTLPSIRLTVSEYLSRVISLARARAEAVARTPLETVAPEANPMAAILWLRVVEEESLELITLGDCVALIKSKDRLAVFGSPDAMSSPSMPLAREAILPKAGQRTSMAAHRRALMLGDSPALTPRESCLRQLRSSLIPARQTQILLMTDGFYRLVEPLAVFTPEALFEFASANGLGAAVKLLRMHEAESAHPLCLLKRHDDASAMLVSTD